LRGNPRSNALARTRASARESQKEIESVRELKSKPECERASVRARMRPRGRDLHLYLAPRKGDAYTIMGLWDSCSGKSLVI